MAFLLTGLSMPALAQGREMKKHERDREEMARKIKARKIAFITDHLQLTAEEAEKFWPLYNEMEQKRNEITRDLMQRFRDREDEQAELTDSEAENIIQQRFDQEQALLDLKKEYHSKFTGILPPSRVLKLYEIENNFRRHLMESLRLREGEKAPGGGAEGKPERGAAPRR